LERKFKILKIQDKERAVDVLNLKISEDIQVYFDVDITVVIAMLLQLKSD